MTTPAVISSVKQALKSSELVTAAKALRKAGTKSVLFGGKAKPVSPAAIAALEACGCTCSEWSRVRALPGFDGTRVTDTRFVGDVVLGKFEQEVTLGDGVTVPAGISHATLSNCEVGDDCFISDVGVLANYVVHAKSVIFRCGVVATTPGAVFGNGVEIPIAIETGGRELLTFAEITVPDAATVCSSRGDAKLLADYASLVGQYVEAVKSDRGTICAGARLRNTPRVVDAFVGPGAVIDSALLVQNSTLLSTPEEKTEVLDGALVRASILQWGCEVASMAIVDQSVLTEHSHVERHGKVTQSLLGPNTGIAEGEVTASLCGPFVGFHHQSLLIAAFWPEGKGNVGYGANVGSNHTSKAPDQELWPGEGTFFGLGVNIKFPSDFSRAPYSIIATAVNALPQKVTFPFSLINSPASGYPGISPAYNEIIPAWVLSDNIYTIRRNEGKYKKRNKARRSRFVFDVFRPDIVHLMIDARSRLSSVNVTRDVYSDKDVPGLGKNFMLESSRAAAVETYTFYIRYYALLGLKTRVQSAGKSQLKNLLTTRTTDARWEHERKCLLGEFGESAALSGLLQMLCDAQERIARDTQESKEKDDKRGARIIDDYRLAHKSADQDSFVKETWNTTRRLQDEIKELLAKVGA